MKRNYSQRIIDDLRVYYLKYPAGSLCSGENIRELNEEELRGLLKKDSGRNQIKLSSLKFSSSEKPSSQESPSLLSKCLSNSS